MKNGWFKKLRKKDILILAKSGCFWRIWGCNLIASEVKSGASQSRKRT